MTELFSSDGILGFIQGNEQSPVSFYTLLHLFFGFLWGYFSGSLLSLVIIHTVFEIFENSIWGVRFFQNISDVFQSLVARPPWVSYSGDSLSNSIFDLIAAIIGWLISYIIK